MGRTDTYIRILGGPQVPLGPSLALNYAYSSRQRSLADDLICHPCHYFGLSWGLSGYATVKQGLDKGTVVHQSKILIYC